MLTCFTVHSHRLLRSAEGIFGHTFVHTVVGRLLQPDGDAHRHLEDVILERGVVRAALQYDFALALHPVVDGVRLGLAVALEGNPAAQLGLVLARRQPHNRLD